MSKVALSVVCRGRFGPYAAGAGDTAQQQWDKMNTVGLLAVLLGVLVFAILGLDLTKQSGPATGPDAQSKIPLLNSQRLNDQLQRAPESEA